MFICSCSNSPGTRTSNGEVNESTESSIEELGIYQDAIIALNDNDLDKAEALFTQMSVRQPNIAGPWANLALIQVKQGNLAQAETFVEKALIKNSKMPQALNLSGYLAQKNGKVKEAEAQYLKALSEKPDYALAHYNVALLYDVYLQDIEKAIQHYQLYLSYNDKKDQGTEDWLEGLKATMAATN